MYSPSYSTFLLSSSLHFLSLLLHSALSFPASDLSFFKCRPTHQNGEFALRLVSRPGSNLWSRLSANVQVKHSNYLIKWTKETHLNTSSMQKWTMSSTSLGTTFAPHLKLNHLSSASYLSTHLLQSSLKNLTEWTESFFLAPIEWFKAISRLKKSWRCQNKIERHGWVLRKWCIQLILYFQGLWRRFPYPPADAHHLSLSTMTPRSQN